MYDYGFYLKTLILVGISLDLLLLLSVSLAVTISRPKIQHEPHVPPFSAYIPEDEWGGFVEQVEKKKYRVGPEFVPRPRTGGEPEKPKPESPKPKQPEPADPELLGFLDEVANEFGS